MDKIEYFTNCVKNNISIDEEKIFNKNDYKY